MELKKIDGISQRTNICNYYNLISPLQALPMLHCNKYKCICMKNDPLIARVYFTCPDVPRIGIELLAKEFVLSGWSESTTVPRDELLRQVCGKDAIFCTENDKIDAELLDCAGANLKVISTMSNGFDHIDVDECKKRGIRIGYTPDVLADARAEYTFRLLLLTAEHIMESSREREFEYTPFTRREFEYTPFTRDEWFRGIGLKDSCVGFIGFGCIGQGVAKRIRQFKPSRMMYSNLTASPTESNSIDIDFVCLEELLKKSDFIIITTSLTTEKKHFLNEREFTLIKKNVILINTARCGVIREYYLYMAFKEKRIKGAGLEFTTPEALTLFDPLITLSNCIVVPHEETSETNIRIEMSRMTAINILNGLKRLEMLSEL